MNTLSDVSEIMTAKEKADIFNDLKAANPQQTVDILVDAGIVEPKAWWRSIGIDGSVAGFSGALAVLAVALAKAMGKEIDIGSTELMIGAVLSMVINVLTWWGRVHAVQPISRVQVLPGVTLK